MKVEKNTRTEDFVQERLDYLSKTIKCVNPYEINFFGEHHNQKLLFREEEKII